MPFPRKLNMESIRRCEDIDICDYQNLKDGKDFKTTQGRTIANADLTLDPPEPLSYAYCSDTAYFEPIVEYLEGVDLLYHESTFLEEHSELADMTRHSTAREAAMIASKAKVGKLLLGHYSGRYKDLELFLTEARKEFKSVELCDTGKVFEIDNKPPQKREKLFSSKE
jgi:ribonuclease Z